MCPKTKTRTLPSITISAPISPGGLPPLQGHLPRWEYFSERQALPGCLPGPQPLLSVGDSLENSNLRGWGPNVSRAWEAKCGGHSVSEISSFLSGRLVTKTAGTVPWGEGELGVCNSLQLRAVLRTLKHSSHLKGGKMALFWSQM